MVAVVRLLRRHCMPTSPRYLFLSVVRPLRPNCIRTSPLVVRPLRRDFIPTSIFPRENLHMSGFFCTFAPNFDANG